MWKVEVSPKIVALFGGRMVPRWARMVTAPVSDQYGHGAHRQPKRALCPLISDQRLQTLQVSLCCFKTFSSISMPIIRYRLHFACGISIS